MLEETLMLLGVEIVFDENGELTEEAEKAKNIAIQIVNGFENMGLVKNISNHSFEDSIDEIVTLGY